MTIKLTKREEEVFYWIQKGASNKHIAQRVNMTESTVKAHITNIMKKYGVKNRMQLVLSTVVGQPIDLLPIELEQEPVLWFQESAKTITGFSTKAIDGWTPAYRKI